jgi:hypothetical protein
MMLNLIKRRIVWCGKLGPLFTDVALRVADADLQFRALR